MKAIVDRIEGKVVVCQLEDEKILDVDISDFIDIPNEGNIVECINGKWKVLQKETINREKYINEITKNMWKN